MILVWVIAALATLLGFLFVICGKATCNNLMVGIGIIIIIIPWIIAFFWCIYNEALKI